MFDFPKPDKTYVDGSEWIDYPDYHGISLGFGVIELNLIIDANGRFHISGSGGKGITAGVGYSESYLCKFRSCLVERSSIDDVMDAIDGICGTGGIIFIKGRAFSVCLGSDIRDVGSYPLVSTHYLGQDSFASKILLFCE